MSITMTTSLRPMSFGNKKAEFTKYVITSGSTTGSLTAPTLSRVDFVLLGENGPVLSAIPTYSTNTANLGTFSVPTATAAALTTQGLTLTAVATDNTGNAITIAFTTGGTAGAEVVTVTGNAISVQIEDGVSSVTQVRTAMQAAAPCTALVTTTGTSASAVAVAAALHLAGGITGGCAGLCMFIGA